jgi:hypothetical protein
MKARKGSQRVPAAALMTVTMSVLAGGSAGCSFVYTKGPQPEARPPPPYAFVQGPPGPPATLDDQRTAEKSALDCTSSNAAPILRSATCSTCRPSHEPVQRVALESLQVLDEIKPREGSLFRKGSLTMPMSDALLTEFRPKSCVAVT